MIQTVKRTVLLVLGLGIAAVSCEPAPEVVPIQRGAEYFPLAVGAYSIYDVDSTRIHQNVEANYKFQLRMSVTSSFPNDAGGTTYLLRREKRTDAMHNWKTTGTWSAWTDESKAVLIEGNTRFVQLQFPIDVGIEWNGNAMNNIGGDDFCNDLPCDVYEVSAVDPDVLVVQNDEPDLLVKYDVRRETYRKDVGLMSKEMTVLEYCTTQDCFGKQFVNEGTKFTQTLIEHGQI